MLRSRERRCNPAATGKASTCPTCAARHCFSVLRSWCRPPSGFNVGGQWGSSSTRLLVARGRCNSYLTRQQYRDRSEGRQAATECRCLEYHQSQARNLGDRRRTDFLHVRNGDQTSLPPSSRSRRTRGRVAVIPSQVRGTTRTYLSITLYNSSRARLFLKEHGWRAPNAVLN